MNETSIGEQRAQHSAVKIAQIVHNSKDCADDCNDCPKCKEKEQTHSIILNNTISSISNWDTLNDQRHLVVPVVMAREGVMNSILYTNEELKKFPEKWNGRMVPVSHPEDPSGAKVTINTPEAINEFNVGIILNAQYTEENGKGKLSAEIWLNESLTNLKAPGLLANLQAGQQVEVSTGLHGDYIWEGGVFNDSSYIAKIINFRPDHLAILLNEEGACSIKDGCGLNTNSKKKEIFKSSFEWIKSKLGFESNSEHGIAHNDIRESLRGLLTAKHGTDETSVFIEEVFDDVVVYEIFSDGIATLFQIDYMINSSDQVSLANDIPVEVQRKTDFVPVSTAQAPLNINKVIKTEKESLMKDDERKALVDKIIANEALPFVEEDRDALNKYDDEKLNKFSEIVPPVTTNKDDDEKDESDKKDKDDKSKDEKEVPEVTTNQDQASEPVIEKLMTEIQDLKKSIPELVSNAVKTEKESNEKAPIVAALVANKKNILGEATLKSMPLDELRKYQAQVTPMSMIGIQGSESGMETNADDDQPGAMPEIDWKESAEA